VQIADLGAGLKTGSLVEHTNSINTVTDLLTVSKIDLMALSSGNVGLPGRPPMHIVDRLFNCSSVILPCLGGRGPRPSYLELRENYTECLQKKKTGP
jgi:hypothetical protein